MGKVPSLKANYKASPEGDDEKKALYLAELEAADGAVGLALRQTGIGLRTLKRFQNEDTDFARREGEIMDLAAINEKDRLIDKSNEHIFEGNSESQLRFVMQHRLEEFAKKSEKTVNVQGRIEHDHRHELSEPERKQLILDAAEAIELEEQEDGTYGEEADGPADEETPDEEEKTDRQGDEG